MTEERSERRVVVNDHVDAFAAASGIGPRINLVEKMVFEVHLLVGTRIEDGSERAQYAGGKERNQQNDGAGQSEPAWRQSGKEQHEQFVAGDSKPVDEDIEPVGGGVPFGYNEEGMEDDHGDGCADEKEPHSRRDARPEDPQKNHRYCQQCEHSSCNGDVHAFVGYRFRRTRSS